jgi:hypothetical protein
MPFFGTFGIRFGVSSLGPLSVYVEAGIPIILEPISGLAITNFRGGIDFNSSLDNPANPFALRNGQYQPPLSQTLTDWITAISGKLFVTLSRRCWWCARAVRRPWPVSFPTLRPPAGG